MGIRWEGLVGVQGGWLRRRGRVLMYCLLL